MNVVASRAGLVLVSETELAAGGDWSGSHQSSWLVGRPLSVFARQRLSQSVDAGMTQ